MSADTAPGVNAEAVRPLALGWPHLLRAILLPFAVTRIMLVLVGWIAMNQLHHQPVTGAWQIGPSGMVTPTQSPVSANAWPVVNMWSRWDAGWYLTVAKNGYSFSAGSYSNTAFYPLYPMCMRLVHAIIPGSSDASWFAAGVVVSNLALLVALLYLFELVRAQSDEATAARSVLYLLIFPTTLFLSAVYSESSFLALSLACFYYARRAKWWWAGLCGAGAALTRAAGVLLVIPLAIIYLEQMNWKIRFRLHAMAIGMVPLALLSYSTYLRLSFHNAMAVKDAQAAWGRKLTWQWNTIIEFFRGPLAVHSGAHSIIDLATVVIFCLLTIVVARRLALAYTAYTVACLLLITAWGSFISAPRYVLMMFPCIIVLAILGKNEKLDRAITVLSSGLAALFMVLFTVWEWVS